MVRVDMYWSPSSSRAQCGGAGGPGVVIDAVTWLFRRRGTGAQSPCRWPRKRERVINPSGMRANEMYIRESERATERERRVSPFVGMHEGQRDHGPGYFAIVHQLLVAVLEPARRRR